MKIANFDPVVITNAGGIIVTAQQANAALSAGLEYVAINPSVAVKLIDDSDGANWANIPGAKAGTAANSPLTCGASTPTMVAHHGGAIKGISTGADSTVTFAFCVDQ